MQSLSAKIISALLRGIFHSRFVNNAELSNNAGKKAKPLKSHYKPSKEFNYSIHKLDNNASYELLEPKIKCNDKVVLLLHGGSFKIKLIDLYRHLAEKFSKLLNYCTVYNLDYRTFPEFTHPAQLEDTTKMYKLLLDKGINPNNIVLIGDSAGANLALTAPLYFRENNIPLPSAIVCFSLWGDLTNSGKSYIKNCYKDPFGISKKKNIEDNISTIRRISKYAKDLDRNSIYVSPSFADFTNFPPVTLICGTGEMGESDSDIAFENMKKAGVDVALYKYEDMFHDFQLVPFFPESKDAFKKVKNRIIN
jgi:acetyl esterase/lipase